jgi:hypothetical protein
MYKSLAASLPLRWQLHQGLCLALAAVAHGLLRALVRVGLVMGRMGCLAATWVVAVAVVLTMRIKQLQGMVERVLPVLSLLNCTLRRLL